MRVVVLVRRAARASLGAAGQALRGEGALCAPPRALVGVIVDPTAAFAVGDAGEIESWALTKVGLSGAELSYRKHFRPQPIKGPIPTPRQFGDAAALAKRLRADGLVRGGG